MNRRIKKLAIPVILGILTATLMITAAAMEFSVRAIFPENQRKNGSGFFDLIVEPGQKQELLIEINNVGKQEIVVLVETITASTSRNGQINYTSRGTMDESLKFSFEDIAKLPADQFTIPAEDSIIVPISLTVPNERFDGAILGSIRVLREATQEEKDAAGAIVNQYAHVTAVRLVMSENAEDIPANFVLGEITTELVNYRASIVAHIINTQPMIIKSASATASIYEKGSDQIIFQDSVESLDFAPNSVFAFSFVDREGYGVEAGDYTAVIEVKYGEQTWNFEEDFTIEPQAAEEVNEGAVNQQGQRRPAEEEGSSGMPIWAVVAIAVGAAVLAAIVFLIIIVMRKKPQPKDAAPTPEDD